MALASPIGGCPLPIGPFPADRLSTGSASLRPMLKTSEQHLAPPGDAQGARVLALLSYPSI